MDAENWPNRRRRGARGDRLKAAKAEAGGGPSTICGPPASPSTRSRRPRTATRRRDKLNGRMRSSQQLREFARRSNASVAQNDARSRCAPRATTRYSTIPRDDDLPRPWRSSSPRPVRATRIFGEAHPETPMVEDALRKRARVQVWPARSPRARATCPTARSYVLPAVAGRPPRRPPNSSPTRSRRLNELPHNHKCHSRAPSPTTSAAPRLVKKAAPSSRARTAPAARRPARCRPGATP